MTRKYNEPLLTSEQQERLISRACGAGDKEARAELVRAYLPLIARIAHQSVMRNEDVEELVHDGVVALLKAVPRFNTQLARPFATFAANAVRGAVLNASRDAAPAGIGRTEAGRKLIYGYRKARRELGNDPEAIAKRLDVSVQDVLMMGENLVRGTAPLNVDMQLEASDPEEALIERETRRNVIDEVRAWGECLEGYERIVFFDLMLEGETKSQTQLAKRIGRSQQFVSSTVKRLATRMRTDLEHIRP